MKKVNLLIIYLLWSLISCHSAKNAATGKILNHEIKDNRGNAMLIGACNRDALLKPPYAEWFMKNYDEYKQSPGHEETGFDIFRVPTLLVKAKNRVKGRIIEYPVISLEKDLLSILKGKPYTPNYKAGQYLLSLMKEKNTGELEKNADALALKLKPMAEHCSELNSVGYVMLASKNPQQALLALRLNTLIYPTDANVFNSLADAYLRLGEKKKAKEILQKARSLDTGNTTTLELEKRLDN